MNQKTSHANKPDILRRLSSILLAVCMVLSMTLAVMAEEEPTIPVPEEPATQVTKSAETAPAETTPAESDPEVTNPVESDPVVTTPAESDPEVVTPAESDPEVVTPAESDPEVATPADPVPEDTALADPDPEVTNPEIDQVSEQVLYIRQLIAQLPDELTKENVVDVWDLLDVIEDNYSSLSQEEMNEVDADRFILLQQKLIEKLISAGDPVWNDSFYIINGYSAPEHHVMVQGDVTLIILDKGPMLPATLLAEGIENSGLVMELGDNATFTLTGKSSYNGEIRATGSNVTISIETDETSRIEKITLQPDTTLTVNGGTIGTLEYTGTDGFAMPTISSKANIENIVMPEGVSVGSILPDGYGFFDAETGRPVAIEELSNATISGVYIDQATKVTVGLTSSLNDKEDATIGALIGGGEYFVGYLATITAPAVNGCTFNGWFDTNGALVSQNLSYTFEVVGSVEYVAKYTANAKANVHIVATNAAGFIINDETSSQTYFDQDIAIGTTIKLTAADPKNVSAWLNGSKKILGTGSSIEITVTGPTNIELLYKATAEGQALVEFRSASKQILSCKAYKSNETISYPEDQSKFGYEFIGWSHTQDQIWAAIANGTTHIVVTPVFEKNQVKYSVTVEYQGVELNAVTSEVLEGAIFDLTAQDIEGKKFSHWSQGDKTLSYEANYSVKVTSNITIVANYVEEEKVVEAEPVIAITAKYASVDGSKNKISFSATRSVPESYSVVEQGIIITTKAETANDLDAFVLGGTNVKASTPTSTANNGVYTMNLNIGTNVDAPVYARGYMKLRNIQTNNIEIIYSAVDSGSFNELYTPN